MTTKRLCNSRLLSLRRSAARIIILIVVTALIDRTFSQQLQGKDALHFEVAAIKPATPGDPGTDWKTSLTPIPGGTIHLVNVPLRQWVEIALSVGDYALKAPSWVAGVRYSLDAKIPSDGPVSQTEVNEMLRTLLIERFALKWHEQRGTVSGFELMTTKKVLLKASDLSDPMQIGGTSRGPSLIGGHNMSMPDLASALSEVLATPVVDATHLSGGFEVRVVWRPDNDRVAALIAKQMKISVEDLPTSAFTALQEQAGLRLQRAQVPSDIIVVDAINRQATSN
jgi:uncharacterized protein (TIGR03435 family)